MKSPHLSRSCRCQAVEAFRSCRRKTVAESPLTRALASAASLLLTLLSSSATAQSTNEPPPFLRTGPSLTQAPEEATPFVKNRWIDRNGDGWDDIWCLISAMPAPNDKTKDTDGDGVSDYDEMLHWRNPRVKGPPLGWPNYTVEELLQAQVANEAMRRQNEAHMARRRVELRRHMGREIGVDHVTGRGLSLAEIEARRMQKFRTRVNHERPLKAARMDQARQYLRRHGMPEVIEGADGSVMRFANERNGKPVYYQTQNVGAGETISADELNAATPAGLGLNLTGAGVNVGHFDTGNALFDHPEFSPLAGSMAPRILDMEDELNLEINPAGTLTENRHSTHTAGTIIAKGLAGYVGSRGLAWGAKLESCYFQNEVSLMATIATNPNPSDDFPVSNHSYGVPYGYEIAANGSMTWVGYLADANVFSTDQGAYTQESCALDEFIEEAIYTLPVFAAGNDRDDAAPPGGSIEMVNQDITCTLGPNGWSPFDPPLSEAAVYGGYRTIRPQGCARNVLTVGSCAKITGGYSGPESVAVSTYSNWGPTMGYVLKPEVVAAGESVFSTWISNAGDPDYQSDGGTSMAAPTVTAAIALLVEHYQSFYGTAAKLWASTLKALIVHTADDVDSTSGTPHPDGPDYRAGYGLVNAKGAAQIITADGTHGQHPYIIQGLARQTFPYPTEFKVEGLVAAGGPARVTLSYSDVPSYPHLPPPEGHCYGETLIHCNFRVRRESTTTDSGTGLPLTTVTYHYPWSLNPNAPTAAATRSGYSLENVQVIDIPAMQAGDLCEVELCPLFEAMEVQGTTWGPLTLPVSIIISGLEAGPSAPEFKITNFEQISSGPSAFSLSWPSPGGFFYRVETSSDLVNWARAKKPVGAGVEIGDLAPLTGTSTAEVMVEGSNTRQFWRVRKLHPWEVSP